MHTRILTATMATGVALLVSSVGTTAGQQPGVKTFDADTVIVANEARMKNLRTQYELADTRITDYLQQSMLAIQQGHRTGYEHFRVWFRELRDAQKSASVSVAQEIIKYAFPKLLDQILPGSGAIAKEVQSALTTLGKVDSLLSIPEGNVELFLDKLGAAEEKQIEGLLDVPKKFKQSHKAEFSAAQIEYMDVRLQNPDSSADSATLPPTVVDMLTSLGVPPPGAATARGVAEEVLRDHILTVMRSDAEWRTWWPYSETDYATAHALRVLDKEGNKKRICQAMRSWTYYRIFDPQVCAPLLRQ
jgi:hypothetical protein